jgi:hypothetical protein
VTKRFAAPWPSPQRRPWRAIRTRRGWLITIALTSAALAVKLTTGVGVALLILRHLLH